ncbi:CDP-alcohol phosphatidyltransferase-domain-containing protein [Radiomyces spectabilis]|uniref:CDP-alcohol phosphatidyltransferase-domain-containing protein n=1 Tax=Radiomyces spectabilis TaxID=64574 RepID=UPI0022202294|nr:CDP-alcohol phosphatidyltransferase-domain-containing protein [Radiomyces spectabilis]KAI8381364.1 CDP-alcohol phosphatidyltransferase-domain-containing protein [Radiomyces spectabilis]
MGRLGTLGLSQEQLDNLRYYKYAAVDRSQLTKYVLRHYWNWAITLFPTWIAPNLITLIGLFFMIINVVFIAIWLPDLGTEGPTWIYFSFAAGLFLYQTFDNVDGRQARRTGTSSPLGELFDHGCDALNCTYVALLQAAALGLGHTSSTLILLVVTVVGFYLSTAEEYYTGVLYLGYVNGPTEGILVSCFAILWSGLFGAASWHIPVTEVARLSWIARYLPEATTFADVFVWGMVFFFVVTHCPVCLYAISSACREKSLNQLREFARVLLPLLAYVAAICLWVFSPYSSILADEHLILFSLTVGLVFGMMASDIILAHLTKSPFPTFKRALIPLWICVLIVNSGCISSILVLSPAVEYGGLRGLFAGYVVVYLMWVTAVIGDICDHLGIRCLAIPRANHNNRAVPTTIAETEADSLLVSQEEGGPQRSNTQTNQPSYNTF